MSRCILIFFTLLGLPLLAMETAADKAAALLKAVEGFHPVPYYDEGGRRTIGYGFTSPRLLRKGRVTEREASAELVRICRNLSSLIRSELGQCNQLTIAEESAVISFVYNVGWWNFKNSRMCRLLKQGKRGEIVGNEFLRWVYVARGGTRRKSNGLIIRRSKERNRFLG